MDLLDFLIYIFTFLIGFASGYYFGEKEKKDIENTTSLRDRG